MILVFKAEYTRAMNSRRSGYSLSPRDENWPQVVATTVPVSMLDNKPVEQQLEYMDGSSECADSRMGMYMRSPNMFRGNCYMPYTPDIDSHSWKRDSKASSSRSNNDMLGSHTHATVTMMGNRRNMQLDPELRCSSGLS